jgi:hypothetical protein
MTLNGRPIHDLYLPSRMECDRTELPALRRDEDEEYERRRDEADAVREEAA